MDCMDFVFFKLKTHQTMKNRDFNQRQQNGEMSLPTSRDHDRNTAMNDGYKSSETKEMPPLEYAVEEVTKSTGPKAKVAIVGNLHPDTKQCDVYELCTKAHAPPLHVAMKSMNRPPLPTVYFAVVYVRTDKEVTELTSGLNNLTINDHKLVVGSLDKIVEQY